MNKIIRTPKLRGSYVHIAKPRMNDLSGNEEYSIQLLIPKTMKDFIAEINAMIDALAKEEWGTKVPPMIRRPLRDADEEQKEGEHYKGCLFMNLRTQDAPGIVGADGVPLANPGQCRSGDYFRVSMGGFSYVKPPPGGVSFGLNNLQFLGAGESISGRMRAEEEFGPIQDADTLAAGMMD